MKRDEINIGSIAADAVSSESDPLLPDDEEMQQHQQDPLTHPLLAPTTPSQRPPLHRKVRSLFQVPQERRRHHRHKSSLGQLWGSMAESLSTIAEGVQAEAELFRGTFSQELQESDAGKRFFLDMSLTRSMSILPEDIPDFVDETVGKELPHEIPPEEGIALVRYAGLLLAVMAVSSNGTALAMLHGVAPALKLYWRMTATASVLSFFAVRNVYKDGFPKFTSVQWMTFVGAVVCYASHALLFFFALQYTSIGNAVIGANSQAILLILGKLIMGQKVVYMEGAGVMLAFGGAVLCSTDEAQDEDDGNDLAVLGDIMALASGALGVGYLTFAKALRPHVSVTLFMFMIMVFGSCLILTFMAIAGVPFQFSIDPFEGLFGWMSLEHHRLLIALHIAVICNVLGTMGFVRAMQYFDNIIIAVATLLEPMMATIIAFALGVGDLPGPLGWTGNLLVVLGTLGVVYPAASRGESSGH